MNLIDGEQLQGWLQKHFQRSKTLVLVSPFITRGALQPILSALGAKSRSKKRPSRITILTNLDARAVLFDALDLTALSELLTLSSETTTVEVRHLPDLHAKVFLADKSAVIGSGNLTAGGTQGGNIELGVEIASGKDLAELRTRVDAWIERAAAQTTDDLARFATLTTKLYGSLVTDLRKMSLGRLQIFVKGADSEDDESAGGNPQYFEALQDALKLAKGSKGCTLPQLYDRLQNKARGKDGSNTSRDRLGFLGLLGLLEIRDDRVYLTEIGVKFTARDSQALRADFARRLIASVPIVKQVYDALPTGKSTYLTFDELAENLSIPTARRPEMDDAVRWLRCLGLASCATQRRKGKLQFHLTRKLREDRSNLS